MSEWIVKIPRWHPTRINQLLGNWRKAYKLKSNDRRMISVYCAKIPKAIGKRQLEITIGLGYRQRGGDPDSYFKSVLDCLVASKFLMDDRKEWVELLPVKYERSLGKPYTIIRLIDV